MFVPFFFTTAFAIGWLASLAMMAGDAVGDRLAPFGTESSPASLVFSSSSSSSSFEASESDQQSPDLSFGYGR